MNSNTRSILSPKAAADMRTLRRLSVSSDTESQTAKQALIDKRWETGII